MRYHSPSSTSAASTPQSNTASPQSIYDSLKKDTPESASGAYWMHHGLDPDLTGDFKAAALKFGVQ